MWSTGSCIGVHRLIWVVLCRFQPASHTPFQIDFCKVKKLKGTYRLSLTLFKILSFCSVIRVSILLPSPYIFESNFCRLVPNESIFSCISFNLFRYSAENRDRIWLDWVEISSLKWVSAFLRYSTSILSIFFKDWILSSTWE